MDIKRYLDLSSARSLYRRGGDILQDIPLFVYPLLLAIILLPTDQALPIAYDLTFYMTFANQINLGNGYTMYNGVPVLWRGPVFPLFLAISFRIFGTSVESAFIVLRLFFLANVITAYLIGKELRNEVTGALAGLLVASSGFIRHWSLRHIDHVLAFWLFVSIYAVLRARKSGGYRWWVATGVFIGLGYLTKVSALLFLLLPGVAILISFTELKEAIRRCIAAYGGFGLSILPWLSYLMMKDGLGLALGREKNSIFDVLFPEDFLSVDGLFEFILQNTGGVIGFGIEHLKILALGVLFVCSWVYVVSRTVKMRDKESALILAAAILTSPVLIFVHYTNLTPRHALIIHLVSFVVLAVFVFDSTKYLQNTELIQVEDVNLIGIVIAVVLLIQMSVGILGAPGGASVSESMVLYGASGQETDANSNKNLYQWLDRQTRANESIMFATAPLLRLGYLEYQGAPNVIMTPTAGYWLSTEEFACYAPCAPKHQRLSHEPDALLNDDIIYLTTSVANPDNKIGGTVVLHAISEEQLLQEIQTQNVRYIVLSSWKWRGVEEYYQANPGISHVKTIQGHKIYRVSNLSEIKFNTVVSETAQQLYANAKRDDRATYRKYMSVLRRQLGVNETVFTT